MMKRLSLSLFVFLTFVAPAVAQPTTDLQSAVALFQRVRTVPNVVYVRANGGKASWTSTRSARRRTARRRRS